MAVSKEAIDRFLNYAPDPILNAKGIPYQKVISFLEGWKPKTPPLGEYQMRALAFAVAQKRGALFMQMRTGKSWVALNWATYLKAHGLWDNLGLVIVPRPILLDVWEQQVEQHSNLRAKTCRTIPDLISAAEEGYDLAVTAWSSLQVMFSTLRTVKIAKDKMKDKFVLDTTLATTAADLFSLVIIDESHYIKNKDTLRYQIANILTTNCNHRLGLTGTPHGRDPFDLWAQADILGVKALGSSFPFFQIAFGRKKRSRFHPSGYEWVFNTKKLPQLQKKLDSFSISYKLDETKLNSRIDVVKLQMLPEQRERYRETINRIIHTGLRDALEVKNAFAKLRQVSSGFLVFDDANGETQTLQFPSAKEEWLIDFLESTTRDTKTIIYHEFTHTGERICRILTSLDIPHTWLFGGTKDQPKALHAFQQGDVQFLVANAATGGEGLDLAVADYQIFYESPVSALVRAQVEARAKSPARGSRPLFLMDLISSPIERQIMEFTRQGKDLLRALIYAPRQMAEGL